MDYHEVVEFLGCDEIYERPTPDTKTCNIKRRAAGYLGVNIETADKHDIMVVHAKAKKIKNSKKKENRATDTELDKQIKIVHKCKK